MYVDGRGRTVLPASRAPTYANKQMSLRRPLHRIPFNHAWNVRPYYAKAPTVLLEV